MKFHESFFTGYLCEKGRGIGETMDKLRMAWKVNYFEVD